VIQSPRLRRRRSLLVTRFLDLWWDRDVLRGREPVEISQAGEPVRAGLVVYPAWFRSWRMSRMRSLIVSGRTLNRAAMAT
jgi:hypothetical protein